MAGNSDNHITQVLFCGPYWPASQNYTRDYLRSYPYIQVDDVPLDDVPDVIDKYHLCVVKNLRLDSQVIARAKQMKLIMQFGVGLEGVDVVAATQCGIKVARIPGSVTGNSASCAEMAIYLMLGLLKKQKEMEAVLKVKRLGEPVGETLLGKTVFIMGFGAIGRDLAKRLRPFGVRILATKRSWASGQPESNQSNGSAVRSATLSMESDGNDSLVDKKGGPENLFEFAREADIVVTCLALNPETQTLLQSEEELLAKRSTELVSEGTMPKPKKTIGKMKVQVRRVKMSIEISPGSSFASLKPPVMKLESLRTRLSNLQSTLSSTLSFGWEALRNVRVVPRLPANSSFSRHSLAYVHTSTQYIKPRAFVTNSNVNVNSLDYGWIQIAYVLNSLFDLVRGRASTFLNVNGD